MKLLKKEISYFNGGYSDLISDIMMDNLTGHVEAIITDVLKRINLELPKLDLPILFLLLISFPKLKRMK